MKVDEAARRLEISVSLTYKLIQVGKLKCYRHGVGKGAIRITEDQLAEYLASACEPSQEPLKWIKVKT